MKSTDDKVVILENKFETRLKFVIAEESPFKAPLIDVADTMECISYWFDDNKVTYTATDLIEAAKLVLNLKKQYEEG